MTQIYLHADDFGDTLHISEQIYECFAHGALNSTSIIVNTPALEKSLALIEGKAIRRVLHLNIVEGRALSHRNFRYLTDNTGRFFRSWQRLVFDYYCLSTSRKKALIREEIKEEYREQILLYREKVQADSLAIDSHQHTHLIPFISEILIELIDEMELDISNIRVTREPFFWAIASLNDLKNYFGINLFVHFLLNHLSDKLIEKLDRAALPHNDAFIGVLFSGDMTLKAVEKGLEAVKGADTVEVLLHPGDLSDEEKRDFRNDQFKRFYVSKNRKKERQVLLSDELKELLIQWRKNEKHH